MTAAPLLSANTLKDEWSAAQSNRAALEGLLDDFEHHFSRTESRRRFRQYIYGLLSDVERKNGWQLAEQVGNANPYALQHLLDRARWDVDAVRDQLRQHVFAALPDEEFHLLIDDTGFLKKGRMSAGVKQQYTGTAGRVTNCQVGVFMAYATTEHHVLIDRELYLPKEWMSNEVRRKKAHIPDDLVFKKKADQAKEMVQRVLDAGKTPAWVVADAHYGQASSFRRWLEHIGQPYVLGMPSSKYLTWDEWRAPISAHIKELPERAWQRLSCGKGLKGEREALWFRHIFTRDEQRQRERWLLVRKSPSDPDDISYYFVHAPFGTELSVVVSVAGRRWMVEECFAEAKGEVGLDQYEVRSWHGWYRHITLAMLAYAFLVVQRARQKKGMNLPRQSGSLRRFRRSRGV